MLMKYLFTPKIGIIPILLLCAILFSSCGGKLNVGLHIPKLNDTVEPYEVGLPCVVCGSDTRLLFEPI